MATVDGALYAAIETGLRTHLPCSDSSGADGLNLALDYAIFPGGKRLRPMLTILAAQLIESDRTASMAAACAVEFIHSSSLIIDDLPSMDNALTRRGKPAVHLVYGEGMALLAAIALLNAAYGLFVKVPGLVEEAVQCIGVTGMVGGQAVDLSCGKCPLDTFVSRNRKTSGLMRLTLTAGALACGASEKEVIALARAGELMGEAYQAYDDLLDESIHTGKPAGQDRRHEHPTVHAALRPDCFEQISVSLNRAQRSLVDQFGAVEAVSRIMKFIWDICGRCHQTEPLGRASSPDS